MKLLLPSGDTLVLTSEEYDRVRPPMNFEPNPASNPPAAEPDTAACNPIHKPQQSEAGAN
jgi:hypothetical protein